MSSTSASLTFVLEQVLRAELDVRTAAERLGVSRATLRRKLRRFEQLGPRGLVHGLTNRRSNRAHDAALYESVRHRALELAAQDVSLMDAQRQIHQELEGRVSARTIARWMQRERLRARARPLREPGDTLVLSRRSFDARVHVSLMDHATGSLIAVASSAHVDEAVAAMLCTETLARIGLPRRINRHDELGVGTAGLRRCLSAFDALGIERGIARAGASETLLRAALVAPPVRIEPWGVLRFCGGLAPLSGCVPCFDAKLSEFFLSSQPLSRSSRDRGHDHEKSLEIQHERDGTTVAHSSAR